MGAIGYRDGGSNVNVADLGRATYDVVVVGGGIFGALLHLEATRVGLHSVLVERGDFGAATSENSMRIVHGGLRYLQSLNVARSVESTRERQWYLGSLARLVTPLPCLLPIYERGRKRTSLLKLGLAANDAISAAVTHLDGSLGDVPRGEMLDARAARELAPGIPADGLAGAAVWHDLALRSPGRVIIEALKWAAELGGIALNYVVAHELLTSHGGVRGVVVADAGGQRSAELRARVVVNAAGPWAGELAAKWGAADERLAPLVAAWNVLLDRPALSTHAIALQDPAVPAGALKFATPLGGRLLVGTGYAPLHACDAAESIAESELDAFLAAVNRCVPSLEASRRDVLRVFCGVLPAVAPGSGVPRARNQLSTRGPRGLFTVSGTKFTTARSAARRVLAAVRSSGVLRWPAVAPRDYPPCYTTAADGLFRDEWTMLDVETRAAALARILAREAVEHLDDLVLRRTTLGDQPLRALAAARALCALDDRWARQADGEVARLTARLGWRQAAWAMNRAGQDVPSAIARTA
jgi:glycerol-3-phosphate dehydrogenase